MKISANSQNRYTWKDYRTWPPQERWELVNGEAFAMSPSPGSRHQSISMELSRKIGDAFDGRPCIPFAAPMDVRLSDTDVVQPDLLVVCDPDQIKDTHVEGPPTLVIEILSAASHVHDRVRKLNLYAKHGVTEYWLVTPNPPTIEVLTLEAGHFRIAGAYKTGDVLSSPTFPHLQLPLDQIFTLPIPEHERIDEIRETEVPYGKATTSAGN